MNNVKPVVAHVNSSFFEYSETFIYQYISRHENFLPVCLGWNFLNLDQFPILQKDLYSLALAHGPLRRIYGIGVSRFLKRDRIGEGKAVDALRRSGAKLIHAHFGPIGHFSVPLKARLNIPLVTTFYGYDMSQLPRQKKWKRRFRKLFKTGDLFLVEGPFMKSRLQDLGCPEDKIQIQRIALPLDKFPWRVRQAKKHGEKAVLLFCGRFIEKKGLLDALRAVNEIRRSHDRFEFRIVGDGPQAQQVDAFIQAHHLQSCVRRLGVLKYRAYLDEMQKADIFVHPSVTASDGDSEGGAPTTILEAQALGMPVVSTFHADIPNILVSGQSGLLSAERDWAQLAGNIKRLLDHQELWADMGRAGRAFVETYHDIAKEIHHLEKKYDRLLTQAGGTP